MFHLLDEFDGSEGRAADDQEHHRTLFCVILLDFSPFGANYQEGERKTMLKGEKKTGGRVRTPLTLFQIGREGVCQIVTGQEAGVWNVQTRVA